VKEIIDSSSATERIAFVGIGHPLRKDDYSGSYIVKKLIAHAQSRRSDGTRLFDGEDNVENLIMKIAQLEPEHVVFLDACEMKEPPGTTKLISIDQTSYPFFTTHGVPLKLIAQRLLPKSSVWLLAIQPKSTDFGEQLSKEVRDVADSVSGFLMSLLKEERP
jgi:hydrogenase 3 maturation protease